MTRLEQELLSLAKLAGYTVDIPTTSKGYISVISPKGGRTNSNHRYAYEKRIKGATKQEALRKAIAIIKLELEK